MFTVDASVWISGHSRGEPAYRASRDFLDGLTRDRPPVVLPHLAYVEVAATVGRVRGDGALGLAFARAIAGLPFVRWVSVDDRVAQSAAALATQFRLRGADAVYAAVAQLHGCTLVSLDSDHLARLPAGMAVTPAAALARLSPPP